MYNHKEQDPYTACGITKEEDRELLEVVQYANFLVGSHQMSVVVEMLEKKILEQLGEVTPKQLAYILTRTQTVSLKMFTDWKDEVKLLKKK